MKIRMLLLSLFLVGPSVAWSADPVPATAASLQAAAESLAGLAAGDLAALDAYAAETGRTPAEVEAAIAQMKSNYPPGVVVRLIPDGALDPANRKSFDLRLVRDGTGLNLVAIRTSAVGPRHALLLPAEQFVAAALETAALAWPRQTLLVGRGRAIFPPDQQNADLSWFDGSSKTPGEKILSGAARERMSWLPFRMGAQEWFWMERRELPPEASASAVEHSPTRVPEAVILPPPTIMPIQVRPVPPPIETAAPVPEPTPALPVQPVPPEDPAPAVPPVERQPPMPTEAPQKSLPPAAVTPMPNPESVSPVAAAEPVPTPKPSVTEPAEATSAVLAPTTPPSGPGSSLFQGVWSGAYMETGDPNTYKMRAEIRMKGDTCQVTFPWGEQTVTCVGTLTGEGIRASADKPVGATFSANHFPERDALKGTVTFSSGNKVRSFYLLRLKDLP